MAGINESCVRFRSPVPYPEQPRRKAVTSRSSSTSENAPMSVARCPDAEELQRLIEERLGPVRAAEIEAHVESCLTCQEQLERLTACGAWDKLERAAQRPTELDGAIADPAVPADLGATTELGRATIGRPVGSPPDDPKVGGSTAD